MDEKNEIEGIESDISVSIGTQEITYDYNDKYWDSI